MPFSTQEFAARIKAKYPQYASLNDDELTAKVVAKFPQYRSQVGSEGWEGSAHQMEKPSTLDEAKYQAIGMGRGVKNAVTGLGQMIAHPVDTFNAEKARSQDRMADAVTAGEEGDVRGVINSSIAGVPFVGGMLERMRDQVNAGDIGEMVGEFATGAAISKITPKGIVKGGSKVASEIGRRMESSAPKGYAKSAGIPEELAGRLIEDKVTMSNPRAQLPEIAEKKASAIDTRTPTLGRTDAGTTQPILEAISEAKKALHNENGVIRHPDMQGTVRELKRLEKHIKKTAAEDGTLTNEALANLHEDYNHFSGKDGAFKTPNTPDVYLPANEHVARGVRQVVDEYEPAAKANADKSYWLDVKHNVAPEAALGGSRIGAAMQMAKLALGYGGKATAANLAARIFGSPRVGTWTGIKKAQLGKWLQEGEFSKAIEAAGMDESALFNDGFGHDAAILGVLGAAMGDDDNVTRQNLFAKRAVYQNPDGSEIEIPEAITRASFNRLQRNPE